mmetsp:Transcript_12071/g.24664  ORF Transcript_12071/g.24664 Transcript_12071/m.24664 type:complete len:231 (-) Transcript_12071:287-979(-)
MSTEAKEENMAENTTTENEEKTNPPADAVEGEGKKEEAPPGEKGAEFKGDEDAEEEEGEGDEEEEGDAFDMDAVALPKTSQSNLFVMGNKARSGGRDTQFYQVLNVSESWQRNHTLSKKDDQKLLDTAELLDERLKGWGYVVVEILDFFHKKAGDKEAKYKVKVKEGDKVPALKAKISKLIEADDWSHLELLCNGTTLPQEADVVKSLRKLSKGQSWPSPFFGVVWVVPK